MCLAAFVFNEQINTCKWSGWGMCDHEFDTCSIHTENFHGFCSYCLSFCQTGGNVNCVRWRSFHITKNSLVKGAWNIVNLWRSMFTQFSINLIKRKILYVILYEIGQKFPVELWESFVNGVCSRKDKIVSSLNELPFCHD